MNSAMPNSSKMDSSNCNHHHPSHSSHPNQHTSHVHSHDLNTVYQSSQMATENQLNRRKPEEPSSNSNGQGQNGNKKVEPKNKKNDSGGIKKKKTRLV